MRLERAVEDSHMFGSQATAPGLTFILEIFDGVVLLDVLDNTVSFRLGITQSLKSLGTVR